MSYKQQTGPRVITDLKNNTIGQYDDLSLIQRPAPNIAVDLSVVPVTAETSSALYMGKAPQLHSGRAGFRGWRGPRLHVVQPDAYLQ
ncbi:MAG: hypothetical protein QF915_01620, partial [Candidatus Woesearchaeota archaeon]|nr:hypothetical protein [Candidatus Woesearchaeota archaeon]